MSNDTTMVFRVPGARVATEIKEAMAEMQKAFDRKDVAAQNVSREMEEGRNG